MKSDRLTKYFKGFIDSVQTLFGRSSDTGFSNPRRYRLDFIAENTFNRVWTIRFGRAKVFIAAATFIAAIAALMFVILFYTPVKSLLPSTLDDDLRSRYIDMALQIDSLENKAKINNRYIDNIVRVLSDDAHPDSVTKTSGAVIISGSQVDSLLQASEAERQFVKQYEEADRYNLSVLTPIAAEVMAFYSPVDGASDEPTLVGQDTKLRFVEPGMLAISSTYRGTVILSYADGDDKSTVVVQHPNDFVSIYRGLNDCFVKIGDKLLAGQRIGHSGKNEAFEFELWHSGAATNPGDYISF